MSKLANEVLLERAYQLADELASDPASRDDRIYELIEKNDLDTLREYIHKIEAQLAIEHFNNYNVLSDNDVY